MMAELLLDIYLFDAGSGAESEKSTPFFDSSNALILESNNVSQTETKESFNQP